MRATHTCGIGTKLHALIADARHPPFVLGCADIVLCADIVEHIAEWRAVLEHASTLVKPGGHIFVSTLTRTWLSSFIGVHLAEGMGFVPKGTHDPGMLVRPGEIIEVALPMALRTGPDPPLTSNTIRPGLVYDVADQARARPE